MGVRLLYYLIANPVECLLLYGALLWALLRAPELRLVTVFTLITFTLYALIVGDINLFYAIVWMPGLIMALAWAMVYVGRRIRIGLAALLVLAIGLNIVSLARAISESWNVRVIEAVEQAAPYLADAERVVGSSAFYHAVRDSRFVSDHYLYQIALEHGVDPWETLQQIAPDAVVSVRHNPADIPSGNVLGYVFNTPPLALTPPLEARLSDVYRLAADMNTSVGVVQVWRK
jgi:hypothetical protein